MASFWKHFLIISHTFSPLIFASIFSLIVHGFWTKIALKFRCQLPPFGTLFATFSESRSFDAFWSPIGSLLAPFWRPLVPFGRPYGTLWLTFGSILVSLGSLLVTLAVDFLTFEGSWCHFSYFLASSMKINHDFC